MADEVTTTIRFDGGPMPAGVLAQMLGEAGVRVDRMPDGEVERRGVGWSADLQSAMSQIVATGGAVAIAAAAGRLKRGFSAASITACRFSWGRFFSLSHRTSRQRQRTLPARSRTSM